MHLNENEEVDNQMQWTFIHQGTVPVTIRGTIQQVSWLQV